MRDRRRSGAFTLIEIMAVVIIIGLLTTIVGAAIFQQVDKGRVTTARAQISNLEGVLELYRMDNGRFPTTDQGLPGGYLQGGKVPLDPWGAPYYYESPGQNNEHSFDLWSSGADGAAGGEGVDADIANWDDEEQT
jgi:general secretion pathway protein G